MRKLAIYDREDRIREYMLKNPEATCRRAAADLDMDFQTVSRIIAANRDMIPDPAVVRKVRKKAALKELTDKGISLSEAARRLGVSRATVNRWRNMDVSQEYGVEEDTFDTSVENELEWEIDPL